MTFIFVKLSERFIGLIEKLCVSVVKIENAQRVGYEIFYSIEIYGQIGWVAPVFLHFLIDPLKEDMY